MTKKYHRIDDIRTTNLKFADGQVQTVAYLGSNGPKGDLGYTGSKGETGPTAFQQGSPFVWSGGTLYNPNDVVSYYNNLFMLSDYASYVQSYTPDTYVGWKIGRAHV